jgi:radical SAM superfamily enzyme YgiQ (UPF0313 family)
MMRILFLVAKLHSIEPFGLMSLSPYLQRDGHTVRLMEAEEPGLADRVRGYAPHVVGYSVCTGAHRYYLSLNRHLKQALDFVSVFGGPHPTFFPDMIREEGVDAICRGEGELAFAEFCRRLEQAGSPEAVPNFSVKKGDCIESLPPRSLVPDMDKLEFPDRDLYYSVSDEVASHRVRSFLASRGCPYSCTYCFNHAMDEIYEGSWRRVRVRSPANLVAEIASVAARYPTAFVAFRESIFPMSIGWLEEFAERYSRDVAIPFYCHLRLDLLSEERVRLLARAGCHTADVGIEAGDERIRRELLGRDMSDDQIISACGLIRRHGIRILANNMLGLPGCSFEDDLKTLRLNQRCRCDYSLAMLWQPYPATRLAKYAKEHGFYAGDYSDLDFTYYNRSHLRFGTEAERRRIENLQKLFAVAVALPASTRAVIALTRLPPNRVFRAVFRSMYLIFHQTEIFPHPMTVRDWIANLRQIVEAN